MECCFNGHNAFSSGLCQQLLCKWIYCWSMSNDLNVKVSRPGGFHPQPLAELYVNVAIHTAPIIQPLVHIQVASAQKPLERFAQVFREPFLPEFYALQDVCTCALTTVPSTCSCDSRLLTLLTHRIYHSRLASHGVSDCSSLLILGDHDCSVTGHASPLWFAASLGERLDLPQD